MYRRELYKNNENFKNDKNTRKQAINTKRNAQRQDARLAGRNIELSDIEPTPVQNKSRKDNHLKKWQELQNKKMDQKAPAIERPPFIAVVPVGKFIDPPSANILTKLMVKTTNERKLTMSTKKMPAPPLMRKSNRKKTKPLTAISLNETQTINSAFFTDYVNNQTPCLDEKEINGGRFTFVHSTARKSSEYHAQNEEEKENGIMFISDEEVEAIISPIEPIINNVEEVQNTDNTNNTDKHETSVHYLSPFVSTARGKGSKKRENEKRKSVYKIREIYPDETDEQKKNREAALYFQNCLTSEINRLNEIADRWEKYKNGNIELIEDSIDMIDVSIGQTRLLINNKFEQFRGLIVKCREMQGDQKILPQDLEGFWSMLKIQIENLEDRYSNLERYKNNNWIDPDLEIPVVQNNKKKRNKGAVPKKKIPCKNSPRSHLKNMISKFRMAKLEQKNELLAAITPRKSRARQTLLFAAVSQSAKKNLNSSSSSLHKATASPKLSNEPTPTSRGRTPHNELVPASILQNTEENQSDLLNQNQEEELVLGTEHLILDSAKKDSPLNKSIMKTPGKGRRAKSVFFVDPETKLSEDTPNASIPIIVIDTSDTKERRRSQRTPKRRVSCCDADEDHNGKESVKSKISKRQKTPKRATVNVHDTSITTTPKAAVRSSTRNRR